MLSGKRERAREREGGTPSRRLRRTFGMKLYAVIIGKVKGFNQLTFAGA